MHIGRKNVYERVYVFMNKVPVCPLIHEIAPYPQEITTGGGHNKYLVERLTLTLQMLQ